ncbi:MAG: hypothetical protein C0618_01135 [Desulfuromonas sp.]|nr:MAG: hypothetical protein C0618_01135 [Desulfuromonas sp.]
MIIQVKYSDGTIDRVQSIVLDTLINTGSISRFKRSDGWAVIGRDPIRKSRQNSEVHSDRRVPPSTHSFLPPE